MKTAKTEAIKKILLINLAFIGDVLLSTPVSRGLKKRYPHAVLDMLVIPLTKPIAEGNPYVDRVIVYDKRGRHRRFGELWKLVRWLRQQKYDLSLSMNFAVRGAALAWLSGVKRRVGYNRQHAGWFLTDIADASREQIRHETVNHLEILRPLQIEMLDTSLVFRINETDRAGLATKVTFTGRPAIALCPFGSYPQKSWPIAKYVELLKALAVTYECFLIGGSDGQAGLGQIAAASGLKVTILAGVLTLGELAAFLEKVQLLITVDTGPMHLANAVGTPVVALFGPTDSRIWGPQGMRNQVLQGRPECAPCWGKGECTENHCMTTIKVADVIAAVRTAAKSRQTKEGCTNEDCHL